MTNGTVIDLTCTGAIRWRALVVSGYREPGAGEFQELFAADLQVFRDLFGGETAGHGFSEDLAVGVEHLQGMAVIVFEGAGPGPRRAFQGLVEGLPFENEGGEFRGPVGGSSQAALAGREKPGGGIQADGVAEETRYASRLRLRDAEPRVLCCLSFLHGFLFLPVELVEILDVLGAGFHTGGDARSVRLLCMREVGGARGGRMRRPAWLIWCGAIAAFAGAALLAVGVLWLVFTSGPSGTPAEPGVFYRLRLAGPFGIGLTTASLFGLYALLYRSHSRMGLLCGTIGAIVAGAALLALVWSFSRLSGLTEASSGEPASFADASLLLVWWVRPLGIMVFGVAAMLADLKGPWEYVLFAIGLLETPLPALVLRTLTASTGVVGWQTLLFGEPGVQTGLIGALAWFVLAGALYASWHDLLRRAGRGRGRSSFMPM